MRGALTTIVCASFFIFAPIWPNSVHAQQKPNAEAALALLATDEASLPRERKPQASSDGASRAAAAQAFFRAGLRCHDIMRDYASPLSRKAFDYLEASLAYVDAPLPRAYLGSAHLIAARDAKSVFTKVKEVDEGLVELDAALKTAPEDISVRIVRIESSIELPAMFRRLDAVSADLQFLLDRYLKDKTAFEGIYDPARLFTLKARELELRGKGSLAAQYRQKAADMSAAGKEKK